MATDKSKKLKDDEEEEEEEEEESTFGKKPKKGVNPFLKWAKSKE